MTQETQAPVAQEAINIDFTDVVNATQIIKAAIERGTFKAEEVSSVALVFDKLNAFVAQETAARAAEAAPEDEAGE